MKYWLRLPLWFRKVFINAVETSLIALLVYVINMLDNGQSLTFQAGMLVVLKAIAQTIRVNPSIPVKDYVNDQQI